MAKKHLSEDEIKYIISAETDKAQKEIYALSKATKDLKQQQRERLKSMIELESKGKKESDTYKKLAAEYKAYGKQISDNNKRTHPQARCQRPLDGATQETIPGPASRTGQCIQGIGSGTLCTLGEPDQKSR